MYELHELCGTGDLESTKKYLLDINFNPDYLNEKDNHGFTPFHIACVKGHTKVVKYLISVPGFSSLNVRTNHGYAPCNLTNIHCQIDVMKELLKHSNIETPQKLPEGYPVVIGTKWNRNIMNRLIESYTNDPITTRMKLIFHENMMTYRLIVFMCDGYYKLNPNSDNQKAIRFFKIVRELPLELQMMLIHRMSKSSKNNISGRLFDDSLREFISKYVYGF
jgi:hypothetical protein